MKLKYLVAVMTTTIAVSSGLIAGAAPAIAIQLTASNGKTYDITSFVGDTNPQNPNNVLNDLKSQPWFGDFNLARELADLVGSQLGYPNNNGPNCLRCQYSGILFAYAINVTPPAPTDGGTFYTTSVATDNISDLNPIMTSGWNYGTWTWAKGQEVSGSGSKAVPEPSEVGGIFLVGAALLWGSGKKLAAFTK
jgi:hypothetical protein